jgi:hypothetical protein
MKTRPNFGRLIVAVLGVTICLADAMSAAGRPKPIRTSGHGAGALSGQLSETFTNQVIYGAGETMTLTPLFASGGPAITIKTDAEGRYVFRGLPPGEYELKTQINWTTSYIETNDDGGPEQMFADHWKQILARVQVKSGLTAHVF